MISNLAAKSKSLGIQINLFIISGLFGYLKLEHGIDSQKKIFFIDFKKIRLCFINSIPDRMFTLKRFLAPAHPFAIIHQQAMRIVLIRFSQV